MVLRVDTRIVELFQKLGFKVTSPKTLRGSSGIEHSFDVYAENNNTQTALDFVSTTHEVGAEAIAGFFVKVLDAKPTRAILIAMPKMNREAQKLSAMYNIETVAGEQIDEVAEKLSQLLSATSSKIRSLD